MYASRVVSFYIFKENSFCTWHFISFWSSYPYLTPVLLSPFFFCYFNIQNSYTEWSSNEYYNSNYVRKLKRFHFVFSFVILCFVLFLSLLLLMVTLLPGRKKKHFLPTNFLFPVGRSQGPRPLPPQNQEVGLICLLSSVCCCWKVRWISSEKCHSSAFRIVVVILWCSIQTKAYIIFISLLIEHSPNTLEHSRTNHSKPCSLFPSPQRYFGCTFYSKPVGGSLHKIGGPVHKRTTTM